MPFTKGNSGNPNGRPKGAVNNTTKEVREVLSTFVEPNKLKEVLEQINDPVEYINAISKLLPYCLPKMKAIDPDIQDVEPIIININIDEDEK